MVLTPEIVPQAETGQTLAFLHKLPNDFHLTGSRYFGHHNYFSDWDFFTLNEVGVEERLIRYGFTTIFPYFLPLDPNVVLVLRKSGVDVQIVRNAELRNKVQKVIKTYGLPSRDSRVWLSLTSLYGGFANGAE